MSETDLLPGDGSDPNRKATEDANASTEQPARKADEKRQRAETNRANARPSTGPTSEHGKRMSRRNSMKHGQTARTLLADSTDDPIFDSITERLRAEYAPQSLADELFIENAAMQWSRLAFAHSYERGRDATHRLFGGDILDKFLRYNSAAERSLFRSLAKLDKRALEKAAGGDDDGGKKSDGTVDE
jgi:hypothetical protein